MDGAGAHPLGKGELQFKNTKRLQKKSRNLSFFLRLSHNVTLVIFCCKFKLFEWIKKNICYKIEKNRKKSL